MKCVIEKQQVMCSILATDLHLMSPDSRPGVIVICNSNDYRLACNSNSNSNIAIIKRK